MNTLLGQIIIAFRDMALCLVGYLVALPAGLVRSIRLNLPPGPMIPTVDIVYHFLLLCEEINVKEERSAAHFTAVVAAAVTGAARCTPCWLVARETPEGGRWLG
jgi:hypothetical protein